MNDLQIFRTAQVFTRQTKQYDIVASLLEPLCHGLISLLDQSHHAHYWGRIDRQAVGLIVKADVPADDGNAEMLARVFHPFNRESKLPHDIGTSRIAKVQAIRQSDRYTP